MIPVRAGHFIFNLNNNSYTTTMNFIRRLLPLAIAANEVHSIAKAMIHLYYQDVEGEDDDANRLFNHFIKIIPLEAMNMMMLHNKDIHDEVFNKYIYTIIAKKERNEW